MIDDPQLFNSEAKKAWKNAIQLMFIQFGEGLLHEEKEQNKLESMNALVNFFFYIISMVFYLNKINF